MSVIGMTCVIVVPELYGIAVVLDVMIFMSIGWTALSTDGAGADYAAAVVWYFWGIGAHSADILSLGAESIFSLVTDSMRGPVWSIPIDALVEESARLDVAVASICV